MLSGVHTCVSTRLHALKAHAQLLSLLPSVPNVPKLAHCNEEPAALAAAPSQCMDELMNGRHYSYHLEIWLPA